MPCMAGMKSICRASSSASFPGERLGGALAHIVGT
jgi:hypothetical protein